MKDRTPVPREERPPIPDFAPVAAQRARHDGWTPERQRSFIEALADTGSVTTAARMVNMSTEGAYALRRRPEAAGFRQAWAAALDMGVQRLKDEAFDRALNGELIPVFVGGKLMGYRRKKNDRLLMFCLRHFGQGAAGERVAVDVFAPRKTAMRPDAAAPEPIALEADRPTAMHPTATQALLPAPDEAGAALVAGFAGVPLDEAAQAEIVAALRACAARHAATSPEDDPTIPFVQEIESRTGYSGVLEPFADPIVDVVPMCEDEQSWEHLHEPDRSAEIAAAVASVHAAQVAKAARAAELASKPAGEMTMAELNEEADYRLEEEDGRRKVARRAAASRSDR